VSAAADPWFKDTTDQWEPGNINKCLLAGYDLVIETSYDSKALECLRRKVATEFNESQNSKILILSPDDIFLLLDSEIAKEASTETRVKGYRVRVEYNAVTESEMTRKRESVVQSVVKSLKNKQKE